MIKQELYKPDVKYFEDVADGEKLGPLAKGPYDVMQASKFSSMNGDYYPGHYDTGWATVKDRTPDVVAHGLQITTFMSQLVTDWMGRDGFLSRYTSQVRSQTYVGDTVTFHGEVTGKSVEDGIGRVNIKLWGEKGEDATRVIDGSAVVQLTSRENPGGTA
jgi:acyl dehydratase